MRKNTYYLLVIILSVSFLVISCGKDNNPTNPDEGNKTGTFTDSRDNHVYKWVKIGDQTWMAENLAYKPSSGKYWAYDNNENNAATYGYLYDWETANTIAPTGWHLPRDAEWTKLINYLGGFDVAGGKLKESGTKHWSLSNTESDNSSGFTALGGGIRNANDGTFANIKYKGFWWSASENNRAGISYSINSAGKEIYRADLYSKSVGFSVRCVKN